MVLTNKLLPSKKKQINLFNVNLFTYKRDQQWFYQINWFISDINIPGKKKVTERKRKLNNWRQDKNYRKIKSEIINQLFESK